MVQVKDRYILYYITKQSSPFTRKEISKVFSDECENFNLVIIDLLNQTSSFGNWTKPLGE